MVKIKLDVEKIFLIAFFAIFLLAGNGFLFDHKLQHDFPYAYLASDTFQHQVRAQSIKDAGNYRNEASYIVMGVENAVGYYPPVLYHLSAVLSYLTGMEVYDTIYFLIFFFAGMASLVMYVIIRQFNRNVALISLPVSLLVFSGGLYSGFTWGHWPAIVSQFFLICIFWYTSRIELHKSYVFLGIFLAASLMTHTSEALFAGVYLILFFAVSVIIRKINFSMIKNLILGGVISFAITSYYLVIFKYVWIPRQPFEFAVSKTWDNPTMYLMDFKLLLLFMLIGAIASLLFIKKSLVPALASFTMLAIGSGNYFGFREKAFQLRFLWPIFLSFLIGLGVYHLLKLIVKEWKIVYSVIVSAVIILAIVINSILYIPHYKALKTDGLMDPYHWEAFKWIEKNTEKNSKIYFFYSEIYNQDALLRNAKRTHYQVIPEDFVDAINKREIRRFYDTEVPGDAGGGAPYRKSFFSFGFGLDDVPKDYLYGKKDICKFDYLVFDKPRNDRDIKIYNFIIANELLKKDYLSKVFENAVLIILKNNKIGAGCIEQRSF
ncbi:MAG: hypothetical protein Q8R04_06630 [Nanoarchaeota archaeon]|nr:hypothetical protein [Nanoarchaeota archaeon]